jgi:FixJ family two-component response regulator
MSSEQRSRLIAIVDDDRSVRTALRDLIESEGLSTVCFCSAEDFLNSGAQEEAGCLIADIRMPGMSGIALQAKLKADRCRIPIIFITADGDAQLRLQAMRDGSAEFLTKPFDDEVLLETVHAATDDCANTLDLPSAEHG